MIIYQKESLETLRRQIDLVDLLSSHIELKKTGAAYKALCPFHDEKSPSFVVQKGDRHYHCFGCGAHGDAIQFLMAYLKLSFMEAIETLAQRFQVHLEIAESSDEPKGPSKKLMHEALGKACNLYHYLLLHTQEGHEALQYLYKRGISLSFIQQFKLGLAPRGTEFTKKALCPPYEHELLRTVGLLFEKSGNYRDFFHDRITIPIHNAMGAIIGFSARKYHEETFGGKYVNTPETPLFKKSRILFGLNYCRRRIAKERKVIIVEGQIDALRLIQEGFNITVAGQGTAFGEGHVQELIKLGINKAFLALDSDTAGQEAAVKIGNLFQKEGVEVGVIAMPPGKDPDSFLRERGAEAFLQLMQNSTDYLAFIVKHQSLKLDITSPAGKNEMVQNLIAQVRSWDNPIMVHESLRKLAQLAQIPEEMIGVGMQFVPNLLIKRSANAGLQEIDPDRVIESDMLRWLVMFGFEQPSLINFAQLNLAPADFLTTVCKNLYCLCLEKMGKEEKHDLMALFVGMEDPESQSFMNEIFQKKINREKLDEHFADSIQKILERNWMRKREEIKMKIQSGHCSDDEAMELMKILAELKSPPKIKRENEASGIL